MENKERESVSETANEDDGKRIEEEAETVDAFGESKAASAKDIFRPSHFSAVLSKIDEVDESQVRNSLTGDEDESEGSNENCNGVDGAENKTAQSPHVMWKSEAEIIHIGDVERCEKEQRPKSADAVENRRSLKNGKKIGNDVERDPTCCREARRMPKSALKSSCSSRYSDSESNSESSLVSMIGRPRSAGSKPRNPARIRASWRWNGTCLWDSNYYPSRPRSAFSVRRTYRYDEDEDDDSFLDHKGTWVPCKTNLIKYQARKFRSNPNVARSKFGASNSELQIDRFKRSLKLLGLQVTDFGILDVEYGTTRDDRPRGKAKRAESTISTKLVRRSISLDGLKELVKEAWLDDRLDSSHRRLLAQAAYEEWYFRKAEEAHRKLADERTRKKLIKEEMENEFKSRKLKAEEQFRKWIEGKKSRQKDEKNLKNTTLTGFRLAKTPEEIENAYLRWKKEKDRQEREKQKLERIERRKKIEKERQKEEKKAMAERAFEEWKRKVEESEKVAESKMKKEKRKLENERKKKELGGKKSFQTWKDMKDRELMMKKRETMNALRTAKAVKMAQLEERMYEAEQAFEEWLDKIESREKSLQGVLKSKKSAS